VALVIAAPSFQAQSKSVSRLSSGYRNNKAAIRPAKKHPTMKEP